jgi:hypothetical protein
MRTTAQIAAPAPLDLFVTIWFVDRSRVAGAMVTKNAG